jgi:hypothetical protein
MDTRLFVSSIVARSSAKRNRQEVSEDTEDGRRHSGFEDLLMTEVPSEPHPTLFSLEELKRCREEPNLRFGRELIRILYTETHSITIEKVHGTDNFLMIYRELAFSAENNYHPRGKCYVGTASACNRLCPGICDL